MGDTFYGFYFDLWCAAVLTIAIWTCWLMPVSKKYRETVIIVLIYLSVMKTLLMRIINHQRTKNLTLQNFPIRINQASWKLFLHYKDAFKTLIFIFISFIYLFTQVYIYGQHEADVDLRTINNNTMSKDQTTTPGTPRPTLFDKCVGSLKSPASLLRWRCRRQGLRFIVLIREDLNI